MKFKKPKFWDYPKPNLIAFILLPISFFLQLIKILVPKKNKKFKIKTICVGNFYVGGTGKTSLSIKINELLKKNNIKSCFIKKNYTNQTDEQKILNNNGKVFLSNSRIEALKKAEEEGFEIAILDDGLQDKSIDFDLKFVCFNNKNWIGNGLTIPAGPLRESIKNLKNYEHVFLNGNLENLDIIKNKINQISSGINLHIGKYVGLNMDQFDKTDDYLVFSGIGNHNTFISMIKSYGLNIKKEIEFPDHYQYSKEEIKNILKQADKFNYKILTTEKDILRINFQDLNINKINYIKSDLELIDEEKFNKIILSL